MIWYFRINVIKEIRTLLKGGIRLNWIAIGYVGVLAICLAYLEIQIEGKDGFAKNLPCWRKNIRIYSKIFGENPITGYHFASDLCLLIFFHLIFCFLPWNISTELFLLGLLAELFVLEDFFWFVLNPAFGLKKFKKEFIPWHKKWLGFLPTWYLYFLIAATILIYLSTLS